MSHLLEEYAKSCGVYNKIPILKGHYYPILFDKYIIIYSDSTCPSENYMHWDIVLRLIKKPLSDNNFKIVQIGKRDSRRLPFTDIFISDGSYKNYFYIIKKSSLYVGLNKELCYAASSFNIKNVSITGNNFSACCYPYWSNKEDCIHLTPNFKKVKPSFSNYEPEPRINEIKPEKIAKSILRLLNIDFKINFKTHCFGGLYNTKRLDIIPKNIKKIPPTFENLNIRMDKYYDLEQMLMILENYDAEITTTKNIPTKLLNKQSTKKINYIADRFDVNFVEDLKKSEIPFTLYCSDTKNIKKERFKFFEEQIQEFSTSIIDKKKIKKLKNLKTDKLKFLSYRNVLFEDKIYNSYYEISKNKEDLFLDANIILVYSNPYDKKSSKKGN